MCDIVEQVFGSFNFGTSVQFNQEESALPKSPSNATPAQVAPTETRRRGRPLLPENNETRERILTAAQELFATRSFTQVNVREITDAAAVSLGAINYHFGSKDGLVTALFRRSVPELLAQRTHMLEAALQADGSLETKVKEVIRALVAPVIRWSLLADTQKYYVPFLERARLDGPPDVRNALDSETTYLRPFVSALCTLLPGLPISEIHWRLSFVLGIEHSMHTEVKRWQAMSAGSCDFADADAVIERVVNFSLPGLLAPPPALTPASKGTRKRG